MPNTETQRLEVDVQQVLRFFDVKPEDSKGHATALVAVMGEDLGIGLFRRFLEVERGAQTAENRHCTCGTARGERLDGWVHAVWPDRETLYQVEVKNWSAHAIAGRSLSLDASPEEAGRHRQERWSREWDCELGPKKEGLRKVLVRMQPPAEWQRPKWEAVACMWDALHPRGLADYFFDVPTPLGSAFERLWFFSMSNYLRSLTDSRIVIDMPETTRRLGWLTRLLPS